VFSFFLITLISPACTLKHLEEITSNYSTSSISMGFAKMWELKFIRISKI